MSTTALVPTSDMSLYHLCEEIQCLLDTALMVEEGTSDRADLDSAVALFQAALPAKVDRTSYALAHLESQVNLAAQEIKRLQLRKQAFEHAIERLEEYCVAVIEKLPEPRKGARKLEGATCTLSIRPSDRAIPTDEALIPADYKTAVVEMPARAWEMVVTLHPEVLGQLTKQDLKLRLGDVKKALKAGETVPGADIEYRNNLVRK